MDYNTHYAGQKVATTVNRECNKNMAVEIRRIKILKSLLCEMIRADRQSQIHQCEINLFSLKCFPVSYVAFFSSDPPLSQMSSYQTALLCFHGSAVPKICSS